MSTRINVAPFNPAVKIIVEALNSIGPSARDNPVYHVLKGVVGS